MGSCDIDRVDEIVREEVAARPAEPPPSRAARLRALRGRPQTAGSAPYRALTRVEHFLRTILHVIRQRRAAR